MEIDSKSASQPASQPASKPASLTDRQTGRQYYTYSLMTGSCSTAFLHWPMTSSSLSLSALFIISSEVKPARLADCSGTTRSRYPMMRPAPSPRQPIMKVMIKETVDDFMPAVTMTSSSRYCLHFGAKDTQKACVRRLESSLLLRAVNTQGSFFGSHKPVVLFTVV